MLLKQKVPKQKPVEMFTDCHSLVDTMDKVEPEATEKRLKIDLQIFREAVDHGLVEPLKWVDTRIQMSDPLTKHMDTEKMMEVISLTAMYPHYLPPDAPDHYKVVHDKSEHKHSKEQEEVLLMAALEKFYGRTTELYGS